MINTKVEQALNKQLNAELFSSYEYLAMSAFFDSINLTGFATWMKLQSQEEYTHAMKIYDYILTVGGKISLTKIDAPSGDWKDSLDVFKATYKHEKNVTKMIYELVDLTLAEKDHATNNFLQWFISEQVEEEANAQKIVEKLKLIGDNKGALLMLDNDFGQRTLTT